MKRAIFRVCAIVSAVILLASLSLCAFALEVLPTDRILESASFGELKLPDAGSAAESAATNASDEYEGNPVFLLLVVDENNEVAFALNGFLVYDPNSNATYLLTTYVVETLAEEGYRFVIYGDDDYAAEAKFLGTFSRAACMSAEGLINSTAFSLGAGVPDKISIMYRDVDQEGIAEPVLDIYHLSDGWTQDADLFIYREEYSSTLMLGAPVFSETDDTLIGVGMTNGDGRLIIGSLAGCTLPVKYAVQRFAEVQEETEPQATASAGSGNTNTDTDTTQKEEQDIGIYVLIGAAVIIVFLFLKKKKNGDAGQAKASQPVAAAPVQQPMQPNIPEAINATIPLARESAVPSTVMPQPTWRLRGLSGVLAGQTYLVGGMAQIGRNSQCDIRFPEGTPGISSRHCMVVVSGDNAIVCDVGSSYGTYLQSGVRLQPNQNYPIRPGEVIYLGSPNGPSFILEKRA